MVKPRTHLMTDDHRAACNTCHVYDLRLTTDLSRVNCAHCKVTELFDRLETEQMTIDMIKACEVTVPLPVS